jgi:type IV fimbrial biogenesis protein FimT
MSQGTQPTNRVRPEAAGFTLIELLVVVLVAAILLGLGVPALKNLVAASQLDGTTDSFASALNMARSEAGKLGAPVALKSTSAGQDWSTGWTMFVDSDGNGVQATVLPAPAPPEATLRVGTALPAGYTLKSSAGFPGLISFDATGRISTGAAGVGVFLICQAGGPWAGGAARMITVLPSGRIRIAQNDPSTGVPVNDPGNPAVTSCTP